MAKRVQFLKQLIAQQRSLQLAPAELAVVCRVGDLPAHVAARDGRAAHPEVGDVRDDAKGGG